jgi:hypothetical protein
MVSRLHIYIYISYIYIHIIYFHVLYLYKFIIPRYGHLATSSFCTQSWQETEQRHGVTLRPAKKATWVPTPMASNDIPLMEIATTRYNKKGSCMINRCRLYLQIFLFYDLLFFDKPLIHSTYLTGVRPISHSSTIIWLPYPRPPKNVTCVIAPPFINTERPHAYTAMIKMALRFFP